MQCGGMKKAKVGTVVDNEPSKREVRKSMRAINKMDREDKRWNRRYEKQLAKDERKTNKIKAEELMKSDRWKTAGTGKAVQMKKGGITQDIVGMPGYNATLYPTSFKSGGVKKKTSLKRANDGMIVKNNKVIDRSKISVTRDDGTQVNAKLKTVWDNKGTKEQPYMTNQKNKSRITEISPTGKKTTKVTKTNSDGETKTRKAIIPVRKTGGAKLQRRDNGGPNKIPMIGSAKSKADKATIMNPENKYALGGSSSPVSHGCPPGTARLSNGGCGTRERFGG